MEAFRKRVIGVIILLALIGAAIGALFLTKSLKKDDRPKLRSTEEIGESVGLDEIIIAVEQGSVPYSLKIENLPEYEGKEVEYSSDGATGDSIVDDVEVGTDDEGRYNVYSHMKGNKLDIGRFIFTPKEENTGEGSIFARIRCNYSGREQMIQCKRFDTAEIRFDKYTNIYGMSNGGSVVWEYLTDDTENCQKIEYENDEGYPDSFVANKIAFGYWIDQESIGDGKEPSKDQYVDVECTKTNAKVYNVKFSREVDEVNIGISDSNGYKSGEVTIYNATEINYNLETNEIEVVTGTENTTIGEWVYY